MATPLTQTERAYFDAVKQVARSARPEDLKLWRMTLDGEDVAVITQRVLDGQAREAGYQPLALIVDDETAAKLLTVAGAAAQAVPPEGLEAAAAQAGGLAEAAEALVNEIARYEAMPGSVLERASELRTELEGT